MLDEGDFAVSAGEDDSILGGDGRGVVGAGGVGEAGLFEDFAGGGIEADEDTAIINDVDDLIDDEYGGNVGRGFGVAPSDFALEFAVDLIDGDAGESTFIEEGTEAFVPFGLIDFAVVVSEALVDAFDETVGANGVLDFFQFDYAIVVFVGGPEGLHGDGFAGWFGVEELIADEDGLSDGGVGDSDGGEGFFAIGNAVAGQFAWGGAEDVGLVIDGVDQGRRVTAGHTDEPFGAPDFFAGLGIEGDGIGGLELVDNDDDFIFDEDGGSADSVHAVEGAEIDLPGEGAIVAVGDETSVGEEGDDEVLVAGGGAGGGTVRWGGGFAAFGGLLLFPDFEAIGEVEAADDALVAVEGGGEDRIAPSDDGGVSISEIRLPEEVGIEGEVVGKFEGLGEAGAIRTAEAGPGLVLVVIATLGRGDREEGGEGDDCEAGGSC